MDKILKKDVLGIDDFGLVNLDRQQTVDLMKIIEDNNLNHNLFL
ncbi:hypothetical protein [Sphingobacterium sp. R2]